MGIFDKLFHSDEDNDPTAFAKSTEFASLAGKMNDEDDEDEGIEEQEILEGITEDVDPEETDK